MARKVDSALGKVLGATPPKEIARISAENVEHLTAMIEAALERQQRALDDAEEQALKHVPWPLRGTVRKVLRSGG